MNIEIRDARPVEVTKWDLIVGGEKVGTIEFSERLRFHACIDLPGVDGLIQGWGEDREGAILDALKKGKKAAHAKLAQIAALEMRLGIAATEEAEV